MASSKDNSDRAANSDRVERRSANSRGLSSPSPPPNPPPPPPTTQPPAEIIAPPPPPLAMYDGDDECDNDHRSDDDNVRTSDGGRTFSMRRNARAMHAIGKR